MLGATRRRSWSAGVIAGVVGLGFVTVSSLANYLPWVGVAKPATYVSPSGVFALFVDPDDREGRGAATYRLAKNDVQIWSGDKPYTLREVVVTNEGLVAGFAYRTGAKREGREAQDRTVGGPSNPPEYLHIVILGADGSERLNDVAERVRPPWLSTPPSPSSPFLSQLLVDSANDRVIARVVTRGEDWWSGFPARWRVFRLTTGEYVGRFNPKHRLKNAEHLSYVLDVRPVAGTRLLLVHWYVSGRGRGTDLDDGGRFTLFDTEFNPVWSFDAIHDYAKIDLYAYSFAGLGPSHYFQHHPAILRTDEPRRFDIRLFAEKKKVSFSVRSTEEGGYDVAEIGRVGTPRSDEPLLFD